MEVSGEIHAPAALHPGNYTGTQRTGGWVGPRTGLVIHISVFWLMTKGELSYLAPLGSENISAPYFKQCFFQGEGGYSPPPRLSQTPQLPVPRQK